MRREQSDVGVQIGQARESREQLMLRHQASMQQLAADTAEQAACAERLEEAQKALLEQRAVRNGTQEQVRRLTDQILGRESFSYDPAEDELYKRQRDEYAYLGRRAMNDARGAAAGLSGGYDNSFAEAAGQQAYQNSLAQLTDSLPELYQLALSAYQTEGDRLSGALKTLTDADDTAYRRYRDDVSDYEAALKYYYQKLKDEQNQENWEFKNKPRASGSRGPSREKQPDGDLARLVALAVAGAKKGSEKKRLSSGGKSGS